MALGKCRECGREVSNSAKACPKCGVSNPVPNKRLGVLVGVSVVLFAIFFFVTRNDGNATHAAPIDQVAAAVVGPTPQAIYAKVSSDAVAQYGIAKRNGAKMDICVHAGMVAAAFMQAKDEANYRLWKQTEGIDCTAAGVPGH